MIMANLSIAGNLLEFSLWVKAEASTEVVPHLCDKPLRLQRVKPHQLACG
jgi:hypothetical protein